MSFGLDGVTYEIDLSDEHAAGLREELATYIGSARRTGGRKAHGTVPTPATIPNRERTQTIRAWANDNRFDLSTRGRIPANVVTAYDEAQPEAGGVKPRRRCAAKNPTS